MTTRVTQGTDPELGVVVNGTEGVEDCPALFARYRLIRQQLQRDDGGRWVGRVREWQLWVGSSGCNTRTSVHIHHWCGVDDQHPIAITSFDVLILAPACWAAACWACTSLQRG